MAGARGACIAYEIKKWRNGESARKIGEKISGEMKNNQA
jgi:hypothetical protein